MNLPATFSENENIINVIIESPQGSRSKYNYEKMTGLFRLKKVLPAGMIFPCDFGFIPNTKGEDGDPLDALVLMNEFTFPGCLIECRLLGVIKIIQKEKHKKEIRNDRFVLVPDVIQELDNLKEIKDINKNLLKGISNFLKFYNSMSEKEINVTGISGRNAAYSLIRKQRL
jgi:inorganic pyrophosphatase